MNVRDRRHHLIASFDGLHLCPPSERTPTEVLTHEEVLQILSEMARKGYATAASVLERVLRTRPPVEEDVDDQFARILAKGRDQS